MKYIEPQMVTWFVWKNDKDVRLCKTVEDGTTDDLVNYRNLVNLATVPGTLLCKERASFGLQTKEGRSVVFRVW